MGWCPSKLMPCSLRCSVFNWSANRRFASMLCGDSSAKWAKQSTNGRFRSCSLFQCVACSLSLCISITIDHTIHLCTCIQRCVSTNEENEDMLYMLVGMHVCLHVLSLCMSIRMFMCVCLCVCMCVCVCVCVCVCACPGSIKKEKGENCPF